MGTEFHSVSIKFNDDACAAVKSMKGMKILSRDADMQLLPLPDCDNPNCECTYEHYDDRRDNLRRDGATDMPETSEEADERRSDSDGRRGGDKYTVGRTSR